jgi:hypothetical protein
MADSLLGGADSISDDESTAPLAGYLYAADIHSINNRQGSLLGAATYGTAGVLTRAVTSTLNSVATVGNWLGGDFDKIDTGAVLHSFDDSLGNYYDTHSQGINVVGDVAATFAPGLGGVKLLNWGQRALKLLPEGRAGLNMARSIGTLSDKTAFYAQTAVQDVANSSTIFGGINLNAMKAFGSAYAQNALEMAAFETAASATMQDSPIFKDHTAGDIAYNAILGGGLVGGGIMAGISALQVRGALTAARDVLDLTLNPFRKIVDLSAGASDTEHLVNYLAQLSSKPEIPTTMEAGLQQKARQALDTRDGRLWQKVGEQVNNLNGNDVDASQQLIGMLKGQDFGSQLSNLAFVDEVARGGQKVDIESIIKKADDFLKGGVDIMSLTNGTAKSDAILKALQMRDQVRVQYLHMYGEEAGIMHNDAPEVLSLADKFDNANKMVRYVQDQGFKVGEDFNYARDAQDVYHAQARQIWSRIVKIAPDAVVGKDDFGLIQRLYEDGANKIKLSDGSELDRSEVLDHLAAVKKQAGESLLEQSKSGTKAASPDALLARLKALYGPHIEMTDTAGMQKIFKGDSANAYYQLNEVSSTAGVVRVANKTVINSDNLKTAKGFKEMMRTLAHEEGHAKSVAAFYSGQMKDLMTQNPQELADMYEEAKRLSKQARPGAWKAGAKDPKFLAYLLDPKELIADAYKQISLNYGSYTADKYPLLWKYFGHTFRPIDITRESNLVSRELGNPELSRWLDVHPGIIDGSAPANENTLFRTSAEGREAAQVANKTSGYNLANGPIETWKLPSVQKISYNVPPEVTQGGGHVMDAMAYYKQLQTLHADVTKRALAAVVGAEGAGMAPEISDTMVGGVVRSNTGSSLLTSANSGYGSIGSAAQYVGHLVNNWFRAVRDDVAAGLNQHRYFFEQPQNAAHAAELGAIRQKLLSTPEKYVIERDPEHGKIIGLVLKKQAEYEAEVEAAAQAGKDTTSITRSALVDQSADERISLLGSEHLGEDSDELPVGKFLNDWVNHNDGFLAKRAMVRNSVGKAVFDNSGVVYFPPPNPREFEHYAFVSDNDVVGQGHLKMIWAKNPLDLSDLAQQVRNQGSNYKVWFRKDVEEFKKHLLEYDYAEGLHDSFFDAQIKRTGVAAPFFPTTDGKALMENLIGYRLRADGNLVREAVMNHYAPQISQLREYGREFEAINSSKFRNPSDIVASGRADNPYDDLVRTMINVPKEDALGIWSRVNKLVEGSFDAVANKLAEARKVLPTSEQLGATNDILAQHGIKMGFPNEIVERLANSQEDKQYLRKIVQNSNAILSTLMLRVDPLNALNNGFGAAVGTGGELSSVISAIKSGNSKIAGQLADLANVTVPGTGASTLSSAKLMANAYADWIKVVTGNPNSDVAKLYDEFVRKGWITTVTQQVRNSTSSLVLDDLSSAGLKGIADRTSAALSEWATTLEGITGNKFAEEMNRFTAAHAMKKLTELAISAGKMSEKEADAYINTFINRTQGNFLASQRPGIFQGAVGQAVGLFQTYQFNIMQQLFRHISEGQGKSALTMLALQGGIFGLNGMPGFEAINDHLIGMAAGNKSHQDIYSSVYGAYGKNAGDWLLYGAASNIAIDPDLKLNLYSRGDINPRSLTVLPTKLSDIPVISAYGKMFGQIWDASKKIANGADFQAAILQGIEHANVSRPLTGLAQVAQGISTGKVVSTTERGDLVGTNDLLSLTSLARIAGAKPLDEAIARDALYRVRAYAADDHQKMQDLGGAVKSYIYAGENPSPETMDQFAAKFAANGGKIGKFQSFYAHAVSAATHSQINAIVTNNGRPMSQYMQTIMGGTQLQDFSNSPIRGDM